MTTEKAGTPGTPVVTRVILARHRRHGGSEGGTGVKNLLLPGEWERAVEYGKELRAAGLVPDRVYSSRNADVLQTLLGLSLGAGDPETPEVMDVYDIAPELGDLGSDARIDKSLVKPLKKECVKRFGSVNDAGLATLLREDKELVKHLNRRGREAADFLLALVQSRPGSTTLVGTSGVSRFEPTVLTLEGKTGLDACADPDGLLVPYGAIMVLSFETVDGIASLDCATPFNFKRNRQR